MLNFVLTCRPTVVTGEENEVTICHYRAKTYHFDKTASAWKERGVGTLKLLASKIDLDDLADSPDVPIKRKYRLVMRADAVHKVILNVPLTEDLIATYGDQGKLPSGNNFRLLGSESGELTTLLIKVCQLYHFGCLLFRFLTEFAL